MTKKLLFNWSGGKDSALALHELRSNGCCDVAALLTTITSDYDRVSMHGVRRTLLERQVRSLGLPLEMVYITSHATNEEYEAKMRDVLGRYRAQGVLECAFGDIFLEDLRRYREEKLAQVGMRAVFPIWRRDTSELAYAFLRLGFRAVVTCVDSQALDGGFAGREYDESFLADLPDSVDPCGENGEFHSFVYDGPVFREPVPFEKGEVVLRDGRFYFCDLLPKEET